MAPWLPWTNSTLIEEPIAIRDNHKETDLNGMERRQGTLWSIRDLRI